MSSPFGQNDGPLWGENDDLPSDRLVYHAARRMLAEPAQVVVFRPTGRRYPTGRLVGFWPTPWIAGVMTPAGNDYINDAWLGLTPEELAIADALAAAQAFAARRPDLAVFYCQEPCSGQNDFGACTVVERI